MYTLAPILANSVVMRIATNQIESIFLESNKLVEQGDFKLLEILHHLTSGFKAVCTEQSYAGND